MPGENSELDEAVEAFLQDARSVYEEYEEGYMDPDAALWTIEGHLDSLEETLRKRDEDDDRN
ncbi:hypothetical protein BRC86_10240 [Halobacteriales archaeon QS_3_64_16]|nr:MAG: hypothetical protein BRC86_10240 [Halobacteriales archaeon QS_3_64_16]